MGIPLMVAPMLGPVVGGYLVTAFGWPWAFWVNVPLGIVAVAIAQRALRYAPGEPGARFDRIGFLAAACGSATLLYAVSSISGGAGSVANIALLSLGVSLLAVFVLVELAKARHEQEPLLDLRRFRDRAFAGGGLANVFAAAARFGPMFLIPIYLQSLRQQTAFQSGAIQAAQALATVVLLPIGGRLADRIGSRPVALVGLAVYAGATALMATLAMDTPVWMVVGFLALLGSASGLTNQIQVSAMSHIEKDEHREVANGSTILSVLHATAAPMGVAALSSLVQGRSRMLVQRLAAGGMSRELLSQQSTLLAMHSSFLVACGLVLAAAAALLLLPRRGRDVIAQEQRPPQPVDWNAEPGSADR